MKKDNIYILKLSIIYSINSIILIFFIPYILDIVLYLNNININLILLPVIGIVSILIGTLYSSEYLKSNYIINKTKYIIIFSSILYVIFELLILFYDIKNAGEYTTNDFLFFLLSIISFIVFSNFYLKENLSLKKDIKSKYSIKDKFFSIKNEKSISSKQFFFRMSIIGFLIGLLSVFVLTYCIFTHGDNLEIFFLSYLSNISILYYFILIFFVPKLIFKRCHDFGNKGILIVNIFILLFVFFIATDSLISLYMFTELGYLIDYLNILKNISFYGLIILVLYLLFKPGIKGKNKY